MSAGSANLDSKYDWVVEMFPQLFVEVFATAVMVAAAANSDSGTLATELADYMVNLRQLNMAMTD